MEYSVRRANWMNDMAAVERGREEVEILEAEHVRQLTSYSRYMEVWAGIAQDTAAAQSPGASAYAMKRRQLYSFLRAETERRWALAKEAALSGIEKAKLDGTVSDLASNYGKYLDADYVRRREIADAERAIQDLEEEDDSDSS